MTNKKKGQGNWKQIAQTIIFIDDGFKVKAQFFDPIKQPDGSHQLLIRFKNCWTISDSGEKSFRRIYNGKIKKLAWENLIKEIYDEQPKVDPTNKGYRNKEIHEKMQRDLYEIYKRVYEVYKKQGWIEEPQPQPQPNKGEFVGELF